jgi:hypothetical protein
MVLYMATLGVAMSFTNKAPGGKLAIVFDHYAGNQLLQFDSVIYKNGMGQSYTVTKFKYYVGNIHLKRKSGQGVDFNEYYLINEEEEESKRIMLEQIPSGEYTGIEFIVGVDSMHNCSGAQSGVLDPVNAMFWTWNTGYIFLKLEGKSPDSKSPGNIFEYHIGGYKQPANCIRKISLDFNKPLSPEKIKELHIKVDIAEILKAKTIIDFSKLSSVTDFHNATTIADNYMDMFSMAKY